MITQQRLDTGGHDFGKPASATFTIGHGTRSLAELIECLEQAGATTLVDVRRFPSSQRNPQFNQAPLREALAAAQMGYRHEAELGGRRSGEPGEDLFSCIRTLGFRSYLARMSRPAWQTALAATLSESAPCFMCAETTWWRCHRRFIADLLVARGHTVIHLLAPRRSQSHRLAGDAEARSGMLYVCDEPVA